MHIPSSPKLMPSNFADGDPTDVIQLIHRQGGGDDAGGGPMGLALPFTGFLGHDHRTAARVTIMTSKLIALLIVLLAGLGIAQALSHLVRSEEHTSELQSLMRISYAVFCLTIKKK